MSQYTIDDYNQTELLEIVRTNTGLTIKRGVPRERLVAIVYGSPPTEEEIAGTAESRKTLQLFLEKNWDWLASQLPCSGANKGRCTIYPCPEGRHLDCYHAARPQIRATLKSDA